MTLSTQPAVIGGASKTLIVGADANGNIAAAHVLVNSAGAETGTVPNPVIVATATTVQPVSLTALPLPIGAAQDGTDATGVAIPAGGVGIRGWLSGIYARLGTPLAVVVQGTVPVSGTFSQSTQPVSAAALPLPAGAATSANQPALNVDGGALAHVVNFPTTQAVSLASAPLPTGAAQDGSDATGVTAPSGAIGIRGWVSASYGVLGNILTALAGTLKVNIQNSSIAVTGTFFQTTQPVSGTITANAGAGTMAISAAALPLPTGAATSAGQAAINADGGAQSHVMNFPATQPVSAASLPLPTGAATAANQPSLNADGGSLVHIQNFPATQQISAVALPLPANASQDGIDASGITPPSGAVGIRGWLSGSYGTLVSILAALAGTLRVTVQNSSLAVTTPLAAPITGQVKITTTGTAINLPAAALVNGITVSAKASNAAQVGTYSSTVGGSSALTTVNDGTGNGYPLAPGGSISFSSANANQIWINGTAGDVFAYAAG